jgi:hypothetical protein
LFLIIYLHPKGKDLFLNYISSLYGSCPSGKDVRVGILKFEKFKKNLKNLGSFPVTSRPFFERL